MAAPVPFSQRMKRGPKIVGFSFQGAKPVYFRKSPVGELGARATAADNENGLLGQRTVNVPQHAAERPEGPRPVMARGLLDLQSELTHVKIRVTLNAASGEPSALDGDCITGSGLCYKLRERANELVHPGCPGVTSCVGDNRGMVPFALERRLQSLLQGD